MSFDQLKIPGPALLGLADLFEGVHIGAVAAKALPPAKVVRRPVKVARGGGPSPHKAAMAAVTSAGKGALDAAKKGAEHIAAHPPASKALPAKTDVGAAALTPKQRAAVDRHQHAATASAVATSHLAQVAKAASVKGLDAVAYAKKTIPYLKAKLSGQKTAHVGALLGYIAAHGGIENLTDQEVLGLACVVGDDPTAPPATPDQTAPSPDAPPLPPSLADGGGPIKAPDGTVLYDPATDPGIIQIPQRGGKLTHDDAASVWQNVPDDGIIYDGSKGWPQYSKGSQSYFDTAKLKGSGTARVDEGDPANTHGYIWGWTGMSAFASNAIRWILRDGWNSPGRLAGKEAIADRPVWSDDIQDEQGVANDSAARQWGPLIGNPDMPDFCNLQYAVQDKKWFFQSQNAPVWATAEADAKIKQANAKTIAANRAAAQVQLAQMLKDAADQKAAQAAQDAQNALAESQAASQATQAQSQADASSAQQETQAQQLLLEQARAQQQQRAAEAQQQIEAGKILLQRAQQAPGGYGGDDDGYGDQGGDDGDDESTDEQYAQEGDVQ